MAVVCREIPNGDRIDAVSAYGYPGATTTAGWPEPTGIDWSATGLVSLFARERLAGPAFAGQATERGRVLLHDPSRPREVRSRLAEQIRATERAGYAVEAVPGPESAPPERAAFHIAYTETMHRTDAGERYFFSPEYLDAVLGFERSWLVLARGAGEQAVAGAIAAVSDGHLHYFLGGTADTALEDSPFKCVVVRMLDLADELELPLNLGGGLEPGDGLERFKRGFANSDAPFRTHELVCDSAAYAELSAGREPSGFFPAYRAPA